MNTVAAALSVANAILADAGIAGGARDARKIMAATLGIAAERMTLHAHDMLDAAQETAFFASVKLRAIGHPVSHLVGGRMFYDRWFKVTADVLDPRPETETLIQTALAGPFADVLDLGTGSGAIIVTLLAERPDALGVGADLSGAALQVARDNAQTHGVAARARFEQSDWFCGLEGHYDLVVANPPYIAADEMDGLQREVRLFEPRLALTDEADGLTAYTKIVTDAPAYLRGGGRLIVEIGPTQAAAVAGMMQMAGFCGVRVIPDLDGRDRVVSGQMPVTAIQTGH